MLLTGLITLLIAIPLYSSSITSAHLIRITAILLLYRAIISYNSLYIRFIENGLGLYRGLFSITEIGLSLEIFIYIVGAMILTPYITKDLVNTQTKKRVLVEEYPLVIIFTLIGASFLVSRADLVSMYLSIELQSFAVYILAAIYRNSESARNAGLKYFLLGALSRALILLGSRLIYAYIGLTNFDLLYSTYRNMRSRTGAELLGVFIIIIGFLFKISAAPLHNWSPDVYDGVPTIVTTWLTIMPKISLFTFLLYLRSKTIIVQDTFLNQNNIFSSVPFTQHNVLNVVLYRNRLALNVNGNNRISLIFLLSRFLSLIIGRIVGLAQTRIKRLLAYSTISHVGFMLLALSVYSEDSISAFTFYLIIYSLTNLNIFMVLLGFSYQTSNLSSSVQSYPVHSTPILSNPTEGRKEGRKEGRVDIYLISSLKGQIQKNPILTIRFALSLFSMAGIPPLLGFFAKYFVLFSALQNGYYFISLIAILTRVIRARYYLRIIRVTHDSNIEKTTRTKQNITRTHSYIIRVLTLFTLLYMFNPSLLLNSNNLLALSYFSR